MMKYSKHSHTLKIRNKKNGNYQNYITPDQKALAKCNKNMKLNLEIKHLKEKNSFLQMTDFQIKLQIFT